MKPLAGTIYLPSTLAGNRRIPLEEAEQCQAQQCAGIWPVVKPCSIEKMAEIAARHIEGRANC